MSEHVLLILVPLAAGLLIRLLRRPRHTPADLVRTVRDLITLRMILRDTAPDERAALIAAHRAWRNQPSARRSPRSRHTDRGNPST
ncbi:hypothetical protein ACFU3E_26625 [Streptomyces sp. NPDC057424]|uniref:hypothetical protein n=1 Tax=Streptomyces sp. NPDC057424 TaxID=3346127 RepID=UPI003695BB37